MFIYKNKLYLIFFALSFGLSSIFTSQINARTKTQKTKKTASLSEKELREQYAQAIDRYNKIIDLLHNKTDLIIIYPFYKALEEHKEELDPIILSHLLEKCHFEKLSDKEWETLKENFKKLNKKSKENAIEKLFFEDETLTAQQFLLELPAFLRKQKQEEKLNILKKDACDGLKKEYDATKINSSLDNLLLVVLGIFKGSFNQDISMQISKDISLQTINEVIPVIPLLTYRKPLSYFSKKIPGLIKYFRQNKNYSKAEIEINTAKEDYIIEHLSNDFIDDITKIDSQIGITQAINPFFDDRYSTEISMIPYKEAAGKLIRKHCDVLPEYLFYPAQLIMTSMLYNVGPAFVNILIKETTKNDGQPMTLNEKLDWNHLCKDENFARYLGSFISHFCIAGVIYPLNETLGKTIKQITRGFMPLRVLLDKNLSSRSMRSWGKIAGNGIIDKIDLYDAHSDLKQKSLKKYKTGPEKSEICSAPNFNEYVTFKAPETVAINTVHGVLFHGLHAQEKTIINGIDSVGELLAEGTKMVLPDAVADRLIGGVRQVKFFGEMSTKFLGCLYYMFKLKANREGQKGLKSAFDDARNPLGQKYFFHDLLTRRFSKCICHTIYNKALNDGSPEINTASVSQLAFWSICWYLFNSGQPLEL